MLSESAARERALNDTIAELRQENAELHALIDVQKALIADLGRAVDEDAAPRIAVIAGMASPIEYDVADGGCAGPDGLNYQLDPRISATRRMDISHMSEAEIAMADARLAADQAEDEFNRR